MTAFDVFYEILSKTFDFRIFSYKNKYFTFENVCHEFVVFLLGNTYLRHTIYQHDKTKHVFSMFSPRSKKF